jgi:TolB-like protein
VASSDGLIADVAGAILDGSAIDWAAAESSADLTERTLLGRLRVVASVAHAYRDFSLSQTTGAPNNHGQWAKATDRGGPPKRWGHLRVLETIGRGAFGDVYRAWDTKLDREVALKLLPESGSRVDEGGSAIVDEGRLLARVRHPNVVTIFGADRIENRVGLWMELVKGCTLQQALERGRTFSASEAVNIGIELCSAVTAVHDAGLLHRDIKPHNVMLAEDGRVVLMDFGTGREWQDSASRQLAGTPLYLAPELLSGTEPSFVSDTYSVGVLLFHLLTRTYPVRAQSLSDLRAAHERGGSNDVRVVRPDVPPRLARVIARAIDPEPKRRYQTAKDLAAGLSTARPRPKIVPLAYTAAALAGTILLVWIVAETRARPVAIGSTPGAAPTSVAAVSPAERPVIAVLPLKNLSPEPDSDYLADGLTDEIIRDLAGIKGLSVRSRTSSFTFKDKPRNLREVGEQLGANLVVEGSVLRSGNRLRINVALVQVAGDVTLWANRFDRELEDIFAIQDEISRAIVNELRLTLGTGQRRYDINVEAYELYLKARAMLNRRGINPAIPALKAAALFEQVIDRDAAFAPAYAGLADAHADALSSPYRGPQGDPLPGLPLTERTLSNVDPAIETVPFDETHAIVRSAAAKALQLDPLLSEAHAAMGLVYAREFDWQNADRSFRRALDLDATLSHVYVNYSWSTLKPLEKHEEAERLLRTALGNDPLSLNVRRELAMTLLHARRYEEAIDNFERVRAADPDFPIAHYTRALTFAGRASEAVSFAPDPGGPWLGYALVKAGRRADAERLAVVHGHLPFRAANHYAALGDKDRVFEALERMYTSEPQRLAGLLVAPEMAFLHGDPRLANLRKKLRLP